MENTHKKILIVEDEKAIAKALELKLNHSDFETKIAEDGEQALSLISGDHFDLMVLDLLIPKIDGFELLAELKAKHISIPVVVMTNLSPSQDPEKVRALGVHDVFVKSDTPLAVIVSHIKKMIA